MKRPQKPFLSNEMQISTQIKEIENKVMEMILDSCDNDDIKKILSHQYINRTGEIRKIDPCGWFTDFNVNKNGKILDNKCKFQFGNVILSIKGLLYGLGFILFVEDGKISTLEAYTFEEHLPEEIIVLDWKSVPVQEVPSEPDLE